MLRRILMQVLCVYLFVDSVSFYCLYLKYG